MLRLEKNKITRKLTIALLGIYDSIISTKPQLYPLPRKHAEFTISHFLRRPIANMYSIVFELGMELDNTDRMKTDLNFLKSLNKDLSKAIVKLESMIE